MRRFQAMITGYDPLVLGGRKVVPSIGNVFMAGQTVYVYFQVYGAEEDKETQRPHIETDLMLIRDKTKIIETQPQYIRQWTRARNDPSFARFPGMAGAWADRAWADRGRPRWTGFPRWRRRRQNGWTAWNPAARGSKRGKYGCNFSASEEPQEGNVHSPGSCTGYRCRCEPLRARPDCDSVNRVNRANQTPRIHSCPPSAVSKLTAGG